MEWDKCHLWGLSSEGSGRTRFTKLVRICIWKQQNNCKDLFTFKYIRYKFRSHRIICLLVTVISLEKMLPRDKTMFVVVSAGVWGKNSLNNWCGYRVQLVLPFFFCTPPCVRDSHFVLASCLTPFVWKTRKNCACPAEPGLLNETKD